MLAGPLAAQDVKQDVTSDQVAQAVNKGLANLRNSARPGAIGPKMSYSQVGVPMLAVLALLNSGATADDASVAALLPAIAEMQNQYTYTVALKCQVLAAADPKKYAREIQEAANWLSMAQLDTGMWTYTGAQRTGRGDNSNTQYALLGLHEAAKAGAQVPETVWARARKHFENTQLEDGSWTYVYSAPNARQAGYGSMTAAGIASLYICGSRLNVGGTKKLLNGAYPSCGKYLQNDAIAKGLAWMGKKFSASENPGRSGAFLYYYLYGVERAGMISGLRNFGSHDWYREGAAHLVKTQRPDGGWGQAYDTAFAVLFLAKGNRPVLFQKVQWDNPKNPRETCQPWNRNIHDLENLCAHIGDKLGKPVTWQTANLAMPLTDLRMSPVLFVTGHEFPAFTPADVAKLRQFVETGGTLLFEACCGSKNFQTGFRKFAAELYPEYPLRQLELGHPVFSSYYKLPDAYNLEAIDVGCRTGVFFSPRALSALWEMQDYRDSERKWSELAFQLGTNIAAYATGKEALADRLDKVVLVQSDRGPAAQPLEVPRGAVRLARLVHDGDFNADARCLEVLAGILRDKAKVSVVASAKSMRSTDEKLAQYPVLFMTGHHGFKLSPEEVKALRTYLDRGGFLLAEACCGRELFDKSFRALMKELYPDHPFEALPADHPLYAGRIGVPLGELRYRKALADELKARGTTRPPLEAVVVDGRTTVLYSPYDWSCALEGDKPFACRGYIDEDGRKLALNLVLFAIGY